MYERIMFSGLEEYTGVPKSYGRLQRRHGILDEELSFLDLLKRLEEKYNIEWRDLLHMTGNAEVVEGDFYPEDGFDSLEPVNHYRALVNPDWEGCHEDEIPGTRSDAVWHIPTKQYTKVPHHENWFPLHEAIANLGSETEVFGTARVRREGGEVHMDVFFESANISGIEDSSEEITFGISTGHDYYGNTRLYVDVSAYHDTGDGVGQVMRYLVDPKRRKHTGDADEEVVAWFEESVDRLETVSDRMYNIVADAMHYEFPLGDMPTSVIGFFERLGLPNRGESELATPAGDRAIETAVGPYTAWHMYKAGMWAIEHHYDSRDTSSFKKHVNTVNTLLFNPSLAERQVLSELEDEIEEKKDEDDADIFDYMTEDAEVTIEKMRTRARSISEGVEEYKSTRERLETLLTDEGVLESEPEASS